jgi:hypothetical protein
MILTAEARAFLKQLIEALQVPAGFTGSVQFTIHYHDGVPGKVTRATTETWRP